MNSNCLEGMQCPHCGSEGPFKISCDSFMLVYDDGTDEYEDVEWDRNSICICRECGMQGTVRDFYIEDYL